MSYFNDAGDLIEHSKDKFKVIANVYKKGLSKKEIDRFLLIEVKNLMENLRSALDYTACGLYMKYGAKPLVKLNYVYFPYAKAAIDQSSFDHHIKKNLCITNKDNIYKKIRSYQHFSSQENSWLPIFMKLVNDLKHIHLVPQQGKELTMKVGDSTIELGKYSLNVLGEIQIGEKERLPPQVINADNPLNHQSVINVWTEFNFSTNNEPVLPLLKNALNGVEKIVTELSVL